MILKPLFSSPRRFATGTTTSSNSRYVDPAWNQILLLFGPSRDPHTACSNTRIINFPLGHTLRIQWNDQSRYTTLTRATSPDSSRTIIGENTVCDPLLCAIHNVIVALPHCRRKDISHIGASYKQISTEDIGLQTGQNQPSGSVTPKQPRPPSNDFWQKSALLLLITIINDRWTADRISTT